MRQIHYYMVVIPMGYNSTPTTKSGKGNKGISQFAQDSFDAFQPFINIFDCGLVGDIGPFHMITKEDWALFRRHKAGERNIIYPDGSEFHPYHCVVRYIFGPKHVHRHMEEGETTYFTSGKNGLGMLYLDVDAHHPWQTDEYKAKAVLQEFFPFGYYRASGRGQNGLLKVRYTSIQQFNELAETLQAILKRYFLHLGILCDIEVKGTITTKEKSGFLAKLPFGRKLPCNMKDETDSWNYPQLERFKACPIVNARRVECIAKDLEPEIDDERVQRFAKHKKSLADTEKAEKAEQQEEASAKKKPVTPTPSPASKPSLPLPAPSKPVRASKQTVGSGDGDAFVRNQKDLLPFVREFYKRHGAFPGIEDALSLLHAKGLYSGRWEDNFRKRATRVGQILNYTEQTFDPKEMTKGNGRAIVLRLGRFSWWVRQHFGSGITAHRTDLRRFDPVEMTAPKVKTVIPASFIDTFLVVVDACLRQDPLANQAVPTNRIKKLWGMVKDGAPWNQRYFQVVRERLDRMGIIRIWDRNHETGKAWRWKAGQDFPEDSFKETDRKFKEEHRLPAGLALTFEELISNRIEQYENKIHNTLYQTDTRSLELWADCSNVRAPPWPNDLFPSQQLTDNQGI
jgi:hypothetical protein